MKYIVIHFNEVSQKWDATNIWGDDGNEFNTSDDALRYLRTKQSEDPKVRWEMHPINAHLYEAWLNDLE